MSQLFEMFRCGDGEALVTFVYGESSPAEREAIANHLARCAACAEEVAALGSTRQQLTAWMPPEHTLGFRITRAEADTTPSSPGESPAPVLRPAVWWRQPLPAWAQMAAAVVIFASGMALGGAWPTQDRGETNRRVADDPRVAADLQVRRTPVPATVSTAVTREDLAQIEQRLRTEIAQVRTAATPDAGETNARVVMQRVSEMIAASEARQQKELDFRTSVLAADLANGRRIDNINFEQRLRGTNARIITNQQSINSLANSLAQPVGYSPASAPYVP
jgi:anti-sigma factor RsiW